MCLRHPFLDDPQDFSGLWFADGEPPCDWNRAFEAYGHAMASASIFEQLLIILLIKAEVLRLAKSKGAQTTPAEQVAMKERWLSHTFDRLTRQFMKAYDVSDDLRKGLADAKAARDFLAHKFWQSNLHNLWTDRGLDIIASQCALYANHFRQTSTVLMNEVGVDPGDYIALSREGSARPERYEGWEAVLYGDTGGQNQTVA